MNCYISPVADLNIVGARVLDMHVVQETPDLQRTHHWKELYLRE